MYEEFEWESDAETAARERAVTHRYTGSAVGTRLVPYHCWESPAERDFATVVGKYLRQEADFGPGRNTQTQIGQFRPDMVLSILGRTVGLEVDGREFHKDREADLLRDAALLAARFVHVIYRFAAHRTWYRAEDCVYVLSRYEPRFFDLRAREMLLPRLASPRVQNREHFSEDGYFDYQFGADQSEFDGDDEPEAEPRYYFSVARRTLEERHVQRTNRWVQLAFERHGPIPFDQLLPAFRVAVRKAGVVA